MKTAEKEKTVAQQERPVQPGPEHKRLGVFVGKWHTEGQALENVDVPSTKITGTETYEWLPGGFFLLHHIDMHMGDQEMKALEVIGYDASNKSYFTRVFDSQGNLAAYQGDVRDSTWTFTGKTDRSMLAVSDDGDTMTVNIEQPSDGSWKPLMTLKSTRV